MGSQKKTWILVRGTEFNPGGYISLGQMLTKPFEPSVPLFPEGPLAIPEASIERSNLRGVKSGSLNGLGMSFGLWAEADLLPVSGNVGGRREKSQNDGWEFDNLDSEIMIPRLSDIRTALGTDEVVAQIRRSRFNYRKRLYMITGVRIARGARLSRKATKTRGGNAKIMVDLATVSVVPVKVGPDINVTRENEESYSFEETSDFVYAYRVCEVHYGRDVHTKAFNKGDTFKEEDNVLDSEDSDDESGEDDEGEEENVRIVVENITDWNNTGTTGSEEGYRVEVLGIEDDEEFVMAAAI